MKWQPATKAEVQAEIEKGWDEIDPKVCSDFEQYLVDPQPCLIDRFEKRETAYIVARGKHYVVFFDDIEETFGTAQEIDGLLVRPADFEVLGAALRELIHIENSHG
ncbi:hypothetical protein [Parasphingorhabdus sp.]|uniref:hypothetical protein n=1 Tax=Parasphingorhabdus sp. TaxID=2709688 RepID=UPI003D2DB841